MKLAFVLAITAVVGVLAFFVIDQPVAFVNGHFLSGREFREQLESYVGALESGTTLIPAGISSEDIKQNLLEQMIRLEIAREVAAAEGIVITDDDAVAELVSIRKNPADAAVLEKMSKAFGWDDEDLKENIITRYSLERRLEARLGSNEATKKLDDAYNRAFILRFIW